jgi:hypothetical protein
LLDGAAFRSGASLAAAGLLVLGDFLALPLTVLLTLVLAIDLYNYRLSPLLIKPLLCYD